MREASVAAATLGYRAEGLDWLERRARQMAITRAPVGAAFHEYVLALLLDYLAIVRHWAPSCAWVERKR